MDFGGHAALLGIRRFVSYLYPVMLANIQNRGHGDLPECHLFAADTSGHLADMSARPLSTKKDYLFCLLFLFLLVCLSSSDTGRVICDMHCWHHVRTRCVSKVGTIPFQCV